MHRLFVSAATRLAKLAGCTIIPTWKMERRDIAEHLRAVFAFHGITTVFDIGANIGDYGLFLRREVGFTGRIISAEPVRQFHDRIKAHADTDGNWTVRQVALGAANGTLPINVTRNIAFSSFLAPDNTAVPIYAGINVVERTEEVPVRRFDDVFSELGGAAALGSVFLKLDTQGFDLEVLKGADGAIRHVAAMQSEISLLPIYAGMPPWREAIAAYEAAGFAISGMFAVNRDERLRVVEFDCVMVR